MMDKAPTHPCIAACRCILNFRRLLPMLQAFRNFFKSKIGIGVTLAFLAIIAFAFASSDVANTGTFGGVAGGDRVAVVGDRRISTSELSMSTSNAFDQVRQDNPTLTMEAFLAQNGMEQVLDQLLARTALAEFAREHGLRAGDRLIDSEILQIPAFRGADGNFDDAAFRALLAQRGLTEAAVRDDLATGAYGRLLLGPVALAPQMPAGIARRYASLLQERRRGAIALLPSAAYAPDRDPTDEDLTAYYDENRSRFIRPERRVIRFATFGEEALGEIAPPTDAQIEARFQRNKAQYGASESRRFTQLVVPTEAAAKAIIAEVEGGSTLQQAAAEKGLATTSVGPVTQSEFTTSASAATAQAGFAADRGALAAPARGGLGWYILRVDDIERQPARTLAQVRDEIAATLADENLRTALSEYTAEIEDELNSGAALTDVAKELGVELNRTEPATADGRIYGRETGVVPPQVQPLVETAFQMEEESPQIAETVPGEQFIVFDVADITPSATAPLAEIRDEVTQLWRQEEGSRLAREGVDRILARLKDGSSLADALNAEDVDLPPVDQLNTTREEIAQARQVPGVLALFFSMAEGTVKRLQAPQNGGWFVAQLDEIETPQIEEDDPLVAQTTQQLSSVLGQEYFSQFSAAVSGQVGVERNQVAIDAVVAQLTGQAN